MFSYISMYQSKLKVGDKVIINLAFSNVLWWCTPVLGKIGTVECVSPWDIRVCWNSDEMARFFREDSLIKVNDLNSLEKAILQIKE